MKVIFKHRNGRQQEMQERFAKTLQALGRGTYITRDMRADIAFPGSDDGRTVLEVDAEIKKQNATLTEQVGAKPRRGRKPKNKPE